jgi:multidrug efflux system membrane fusion protein
VLDRGTLQVINNQVDQTTGTVQLKAEFPNTDLRLWPGQFVNVRLLIDTLMQVVVIPTGAVQRGPNGTFVYVIKQDNTASMRAVTVSKQDETQSVISKGLDAGEQVVTTGFARLTDNSKVLVGNADSAASPAAPVKGPGQQGTRRRSNQ